MPYIPHTQFDVEAMLEVIGVESIDDLFDEIPDGLADRGLEVLPSGLPGLAFLLCFSFLACLCWLF